MHADSFGTYNSQVIERDHYHTKNILRIIRAKCKELRKVNLYSLRLTMDDVYFGASLSIEGFKERQAATLVSKLKCNLGPYNNNLLDNKLKNYFLAPLSVKEKNDIAQLTIESCTRTKNNLLQSKKKLTDICKPSLYEGFFRTNRYYAKIKANTVIENFFADANLQNFLRLHNQEKNIYSSLFDCFRNYNNCPDPAVVWNLIMLLAKYIQMCDEQSMSSLSDRGVDNSSQVAEPART